PPSITSPLPDGDHARTRRQQWRLPRWALDVDPLPHEHEPVFHLYHRTPTEFGCCRHGSVTSHATRAGSTCTLVGQPRTIVLRIDKIGIQPVHQPQSDTAYSL